MVLAAARAAAALGAPSEIARRRKKERKKVRGASRSPGRRGAHFLVGKKKTPVSSSSSNVSASALPMRPQFLSTSATLIQASRAHVRSQLRWRNSMTRPLASAAAKAEDDGNAPPPFAKELDLSQPQAQLPPAPLRIETRGAKPGRKVSDETRSKMSRAKEGKVMPLGEFFLLLFWLLSLLFLSSSSLTGGKKKHLPPPFQKPASRSPCPGRARYSPATPRNAWQRCAEGGGRARERQGSLP